MKHNQAHGSNLNIFCKVMAHVQLYFRNHFDTDAAGTYNMILDVNHLVNNSTFLFCHVDIHTK